MLKRVSPLLSSWEKKDFYSRLYIVCNIAALVLWLFVFYNTPYLNDDWYWGTDFGPKALLTGGTNSRYMGNLCIVLITRSVLFKTCFCGTLVWLFTLLISRLGAELEGKHKLALFLMANLLMLMMSSFVYREVLGWFAGFSNYFTAGLCCVLIFLIIKRTFTGKSIFTPKKQIFLAVFMFISMLFVENMTLYFLGISFLALLIALCSGKNRACMAAMFAGAVPGAVCMFTGPSYSGMMESGGSGVRRVIISSGDSFLDMLRSIVAALNSRLPEIYGQNTIECLVILISVSALMLVVFHGKKASWAAVFVNGAMGLLMLMAKFGLSFLGVQMSGADSRLSLMFFLLVCAEMLVLYIFGRDKKDILFLSFIWLSGFISVLPIVFTKSVGGRLYFGIPVFTILFAAESYIYIVKSGTYKRLVRLVLPVLGAACLLLAADTAKVYYSVGAVYRQQLEIISQAKSDGDERIIIPEFEPEHYEYIYYWHLGDGISDAYSVQFKEFYGIDPEVEVAYAE